MLRYLSEVLEGRVAHLSCRHARGLTSDTGMSAVPSEALGDGL